MQNTRYVSNSRTVIPKANHIKNRLLLAKGQKDGSRATICRSVAPGTVTTALLAAELHVPAVWMEAGQLGRDRGAT